tara:strand:- start:5934 stop:6287 length:354 start_codon:yes stop_codon:yes gene_type:complete
MSVPEHLWRFPTAGAIASLANRLGVPHHPSMQDWEWEIADPDRIDEYLSLYRDGGLTDDERFTLMETILQSFEDLDADLTSDPRWLAVLDWLDRDVELHAHSIWYWADLENELFSEC